MKKLLIVILLIISACHKVNTTKQNQAENLIKGYINNPVTGTHGYEKVTFSAIRTLRESYLETKEGMAFKGKIKLEEDSIAKMDSVVDGLYKNRTANRAIITNLLTKGMPLRLRWAEDIKKSASLMLGFKGPLKGYKLSYTYKVKDDFSNFIYHKTTFGFDTTISKITSVKDTIIDAVDIDWK